MRKALGLLLIFALTGCADGTGTGNPKTDTASDSPLTTSSGMVANATCGKISDCHTISSSTCIQQALPLTGFAPKLGITDQPEPSLGLILDQEVKGERTPHTSALQPCLDEIRALICNDQKVKDAYDVSAPTPLSGAPELLGASCAGLFSP